MKEEDERYRLVEDAIMGAMNQLLKTQPVEAITVAEVIRRAGIVRSTFYNHYTDMPSLIASMEDQTIEYIFKMMEGFRPERPLSGAKAVTYSFFLSLCRYAKENSFLAATLKSPLAPDFIRKAITMFHKYTGQVVQENSNDGKAYAIAYSIGGAIGALHKWSFGNFRESPEDVAEIMMRLFTDGVLDLILPDQDTPSHG